MKNLHEKWVNLPKRNSRSWNVLMGELMKNFNMAIANLFLVDPNLTSIEGRGFYVKLLKKYSQYSNKYNTLHSFLAVEYKQYGYEMFGVGELLKILQPYMIPFVKISKAKMAKEFRYFIIQCIKKTQRRLKRWEPIHYPRDHIYAPVILSNYMLRNFPLSTNEINKEGQDKIKKMYRKLDFSKVKIHQYYRPIWVCRRTSDNMAVLGQLQDALSTAYYYHSDVVVKDGYLIPSKNGYNKELIPTTVLALENDGKKRRLAR